LLLTTTGSKTGNTTTTPLIYGEDNGRYLIVASKGGAAKHPMWYTNLAKNPGVEIQVMDTTIAGTARTARPDEKPALWQKMATLFPNYNEYQAKTEREIPLVIIEPS
jgi:deazaflavin-dependent oxidoreductase (nitroreductase family)